MKKITLVLLIFITSCSSFKEFSNQEYSLIENGKQFFSFKNNQPFMEVEINGEKGVFLFDTGAATSLITDSVFLTKINGTLKKSNRLINASGINIEAFKVLTKTVNSSLFNSKNILFSYYKISKKISNNINCSKENEVIQSNGIIGLNQFINSEKTILLNFDDNFIQIVDDNFNNKDFNILEADIKTLNKKIIIPLNLNNKKIDFLFDTGNSGGLLVNEKETSKTKPDEAGEMLIGTFDGFSNQQIKLFKEVNISNFPIVIENQNVTSFHPFQTNTMGMKFINKFNWLIDFKNKKVYVKKNKNSFEKVINDIYNSKVVNLNNKLIVGFKNKTLTNFNINDQIISVNNQTVTPENICEMQNLLNSTIDWNELKIEIKR